MSRAGNQWNKSLGGGCPYGRGTKDVIAGVVKKSLALAARLVLVSGLKPGQRHASVARATGGGGICYDNEENHRGNRGRIRFVGCGPLSAARRVAKERLYAKQRRVANTGSHDAPHVGRATRQLYIRGCGGVDIRSRNRTEAVAGPGHSFRNSPGAGDGCSSIVDRILRLSDSSRTGAPLDHRRRRPGRASRSADRCNLPAQTCGGLENTLLSGRESAPLSSSDRRDGTILPHAPGYRRG